MITLPTTPHPAAMLVSPVSNANELRSAFGGSLQRIQRKGTTFKAEFQLPAMRYADALEWVGLKVEGDTVLMGVPQPGVDTGAPGTPLVNGASQAGSSLIIDGLTPQYVVGIGRFISVVTDSRRYLYEVAADVIANGSGEATVTLTTMLRTPPANNDVVEIAEPKIEGYATVTGGWSVDIARVVGLAFSVEERG